MKNKFIVFIITVLLFVPIFVYAINITDYKFDVIFDDGKVFQTSGTSVNRQFVGVQRTTVFNNAINVQKGHKYRLYMTYNYTSNHGYIAVNQDRLFVGNYSWNEWTECTSYYYNLDGQVDLGNGTYFLTYGQVVEFTATFTSNGISQDFYYNDDPTFTFFEITRYDLECLDCSSGGDDNNSNQDIIDNQNKNTQNIIINNNKNTQDIINNQDKNHEEAQTTRKGILQTILDLPGKLLEMLKSLFIPSENYFSDKFDELLDTFTNKLGFLGYPFVFTIDVLKFFLTIEDTGSYVISWNDIPVPTYPEHILIHSGSFDLSTVLQSEVLHTAHNLYFIFINALLLLSFIKLCHNKYCEMFGGEPDDTVYLTTTEVNYFDENGELYHSKTFETRRRKESGSS